MERAGGVVELQREREGEGEEAKRVNDDDGGSGSGGGSGDVEGGINVGKRGGWRGCQVEKS